MAEIKVEKKKTIWPWVLLALIIGALLVYFLFFRDKGEEVVTEKIENTTEEIIPNNDNNSVAAFITFVENDDSMGLDHEYTNEAILKLTEATKAIADKHDYNISQDLDQVKEHANNITKEPFATSHANNIRKATEVLANALHKMQESKFSNLTNEAAEVKQAASSIDPNKLTLEQRDAVKTFFDKAANMLQKMNS